uniref:Matrix protein n=1 Tax=Cedar virus TaxID=1221391 RepID=A0A185KRV0_9MONO|nr:matrix protein [Cedar virus]
MDPSDLRRIIMEDDKSLVNNDDSTETDFLEKTWREGSKIDKITPEVDENGNMVPKYVVFNPGKNERKTSGYQYMICYGFIEDGPINGSPRVKGNIRTTASFPLGVGKTYSSPEEILQELTTLKITVRRTAGSNEKLVYGTTGPLNHLYPWYKVLTGGSIFSAVKVCRNVDQILLDRPQILRIFFLSITKLTDKGVYMIPKSVLDFRSDNSMAFNLLVYLKIDTDITKAGIRGIVNKEGERITSFMLHIGNFTRRGGKHYSVEYCKRKIDKMKLTFALGTIGGLSLHIRIDGRISKRLQAQVGFQRNICYSLMDINPWLNKLTWNNSCEIHKVTAVIQPSVPKDFMLYEDILIDNTGKILK